MKIKDIAKVLNDEFEGKTNLSLNSDQDEIKELVTDSRNHFKPENALFYAIRTPGGNDGHKYLSELYAKGVRNFVVEYIPEEFKNLGDSNLIVVPDSIAALAVVGSLHRNNARKILAITGSRGKTTLKEIIFQLLEPLKKISRSPRSFNSKIGVPLSLWQISPESDLAVIEAGISKKGEMKKLRETIQPDVVILTNIGEAHSLGFSSHKEKIEEKVSLSLSPKVKTFIYPYDDEALRETISQLPKDKSYISWSEKNPEANLFITKTENGIDYKWHDLQGKINFNIEKDYDISNLAPALAFMLEEGFSPDIVQERFDFLHRIQTRLNVSEGINGCSVIMDSYTSDLSSLLPAIDFAKRRKMPRQTLTLVVSDVHHEGNSVDDTYREMAETVRTTGVSKFIGIGRTIGQYADLFPSGSLFYPSTETFLKKLSASDFNDELILLKGGPEFRFDDIFRLLEAKKHETVLEVNLDALLRNYNYFRSRVPSTTGIIAMVKASGYGAGSYEIAKTLQDAGAAYLAVAALDEGVDLRKNGIVMPIMVMNPRAANYRSLFNYNLEPAVYSLSMLRTLIFEAEKYGAGEYPVHLKLDTGMHRMGFLNEDLPELISLLKKESKIRVASIFSHLATADCLDMDQYTLGQLQRFEDMSSLIIQELGYEIKRHILNSAGILRFPQYHYDLVRLGIGLYGANTLPISIEKPLSVVSTLRSVIICIREIDEGEAVGYSRKGKITGKSKIATIPVGYADGINRKFGNGAIKVFVNGHYAPTIGNICMDATMIDVTGIDCQEGDSVEIFGENVSLQGLADTLDTIPYEVLTSVSPRVKRIYFRE